MKLFLILLLLPLTVYSAQICNKNLTIALKFTPKTSNFEFSTIARDQAESCIDAISERGSNYKFEFIDKRKKTYYTATYLIPPGVFYDTIEKKGSDKLTGGFTDQQDVFRLIKVPFPPHAGKVTFKIYSLADNKMIQTGSFEAK